MGWMFYFVREIGLGIENDIICSCLIGKLRFLFVGNRRQHPRTARLRKLCQQKTGSTCTRVNEHLVPWLDRVGRVRKVVSSHALQQGGGRLFDGNTNRTRSDPSASPPSLLPV